MFIKLTDTTNKVNIIKIRGGMLILVFNTILYIPLVNTTIIQKCP